jgi:hypothetical protein
VRAIVLLFRRYRICAKSVELQTKASGEYLEALVFPMFLLVSLFGRNLEMIPKLQNDDGVTANLVDHSVPVINAP